MFLAVSLFMFIMSVFQIDHNIEIVTVNIPKEATPGKHFNMVFKVKNNRNTEIETPSVNFELPKLWKVISKSNIKKIDAKSLVALSDLF